jgi:hypothetical protein
MILNVLGTRPIAFNADLAHALGSAKAGLFLSQLLFWYGKGKNPDWIWKTIVEVEKETALSRSEQDTVIKRCKKYGTIKVKLKGIPAKRHFKLNIEKIVELLEKHYSGLSKNDKQDCRKVTIKIEDKKQSNTENTNIKNNKEASLTKKELADLYKNGNRKYKPYFDENEMRWVKNEQKWYVIMQDRRWLEFAAEETDIEWREKLRGRYTP